LLKSLECKKARFFPKRFKKNRNFFEKSEPEHCLKGNQYWYYRADGRITRDYLCMGKRRPGIANENDVQLVECSDEGELWGYDPRTGALQHQESGRTFFYLINIKAIPSLRVISSPFRKNKFFFSRKFLQVIP
jgi:hypothetical protein